MRRYDLIRWGVIGAGDVLERKSGEPLATTPGSELIAVMRRDADKAEAFAQRHAVPRWYATVEDLLTDPDINAVYVASPHGLHAEHAIAAARAGKIVLCEKPMGINSGEAQQVVDVCRKANVPLAVAYYRRYWPDVQRMRQLLADNAIGPITHIRVQLSDYFAGDAGRPWIVDPALAGGGALSNAGSHWIDLVRYLIGEVEEVYAHTSSAASGFAVEDTAAVLMRTENDVPILFSASWTGTSVNDFDIVGKEGRLLASPLSEGRITLTRRGQEAETFNEGRTGPAHKEFIAAVVRALQDGQPMPVTGEDGVAAWRIIDAAYQSASTRQPIQVTP